MHHKPSQRGRGSGRSPERSVSYETKSQVAAGTAPNSQAMHRLKHPSFPFISGNSKDLVQLVKQLRHLVPGHFHGPVQIDSVEHRRRPLVLRTFDRLREPEAGVANRHLDRLPSPWARTCLHDTQQFNVHAHGVDVIEAAAAGFVRRPHRYRCTMPQKYAESGTWLVRAVQTGGAYCRRGQAQCATAHLTFKIVKKPANQVRFKVLPRRWIVERSLSWLMRARRNSRDYERLPEHSEAHITWANITWANITF